MAYIQVYNKALDRETTKNPLGFKIYSKSNLPDKAKRYIIIEYLSLLCSSPNLVQEYAWRKSYI